MRQDGIDMREDIKQRIIQLKKKEMPDGYTQKGKYVCPTSWSMHKLGEITKKISKKNKKFKGYSVYSINNQVGLIPQSDQFGQARYLDMDKSEYKIVCRNQFAYNPARINVGSIGLLKDTETAIVSSLYVCFAMKEGFSPAYFDYWFKTYDFYKEIIRNLEGSVREYLFYENFSKINITLPSHKEQQKIAEILNRCDKVIELKLQLIEEEKNRKKWLMQNLLNPDSGVRLPGFVGAWHSTILGRVGTFLKGAGISNDDCKTGQYPCIKYGDIYMSYDECFTSPVSYTEERIAIRSPKVSAGALLFTTSGEDRLEIGKCVTYLGNEQLAVGGDIVVCLPNTEKYDSKFLAYQQHTENLIKQKSILAQGYSIVHLYSDQIKKLKIRIPPTKEEQSAISKLLTFIDDNVSLLEQELTQWQQKKKALMQLLLTGIVRVSV